MELLHPLRERREKKIEQRVNDVASYVGSMMITHLASEAIGDLPVFVGKKPGHIGAADFVTRVEAKAYQAIEERAPLFAGMLAVDTEETRIASTENVRVGNHGWRNDIKAEGITIVLKPTEEMAESRA